MHNEIKEAQFDILQIFLEMRYDYGFFNVKHIRGGVSAGAAGALHPRFFGNSLLETKKMEVLHK